MRECLLDPPALAELLAAARGGVLARVRVLDVSGCWLRDYEELLDEVCSRCGEADGGLQKLALEHCDVTRLPRVAQGVSLSGLLELRASYNPLQGDGCLGVLAQQRLGALRVLHLAGCELGASDAQAIANSLGGPACQLRSLDLDDNPGFGATGAHALATLLRGCGELETLTLEYCDLDASAAAEVLGACSLLRSLSAVSLHGNALPAADAVMR
ncbi:hypothetical protein T492DRAFT_1017213 [Pavlovales sp. CCMP2436]|nr:hypothetical protein T492DRAFT_1017213 [Pavlovales sp. CCMP2436]